MKVLFVFGGLPHYYNLVLSRLNEVEGLEIIVVVPSEEGQTLGDGVYQTKEGINFKTYHLKEYKNFFGKAFFRGFFDVIDKEKPDIIVAGWPYILSFYLNPFNYSRIKQDRIKIVDKDIPFRVPVYGDEVRFYKKLGMVPEDINPLTNFKGFLQFLNIYILTKARLYYFKAVDAHVNYVEDAYEILGSYGVPAEKIFISYNSPDTDVLYKVRESIEASERIMKPNPHRLLHVGRLVEWKRVDMLIKVFARLKKIYADAELVIVGYGPQKEELEKMVKDLDLQDVVFAGGVYDQKLLGQYFTESTIYVLAGMGGLSINEAMLYGKPVVCSVCDGTEKKLVRDEYNGKYFEEGNEEDLFDKINYLFSHPELVEQMGQNSDRIIREEINIRTVIKGYLEAFNYVTKNRFGLKVKEENA
ncbi:MAG: glycosyltransferase family 4 protein [Syntrophothermus sp.]